jgi:hypothetical protein
MLAREGASCNRIRRHPAIGRSGRSLIGKTGWRGRRHRRANERRAVLDSVQRPGSARLPRPELASCRQAINDDRPRSSGS